MTAPGTAPTTIIPRHPILEIRHTVVEPEESAAVRPHAFKMFLNLYDDPTQLATNAGKSFVGSYVLGMGFTFDDTDTKGVATGASCRWGRTPKSTFWLMLRICI